MLVQWLEQSAARFPDAPALIAGRETETYASLAFRAAGLARVFAECGLDCGDTLAVTSRSPLTIAMASWAMAHLGALLPLNPDWPLARQLAMKRLAGVEEGGHALQGASFRMDEQSLREAWLGACDVGRPSGRHVGLKADPHAAALIVPSSGSSGEPRGVMLSYANLAAAVKAARSRIPLEPGDVWQICLPLYHIGGQAILYRCAEAGACALLEDRFEPQSVLANMHRHAVTHLSLVPAMLARLLEAGAPPPGLKFVLIGGGGLSASLAQRAAQSGWPLCPSYGMSEMASQVATLNPLPDDWQPGLVGVPLPGVEVAVVDGRLCLRGEMLMAGYLGCSPHEGWLKTGDLGRIDEQGRLWMLGRADDMLVSGGINIHPQEVENLLSICPGLRDAAVTALPDEVWGDRLTALVVGVDASQTQSWCDHHLPSHLRPRRVFAVSELPRNAMGKLERRLLREMVQDLAQEMAGTGAEVF